MHHLYNTFINWNLSDNHVFATIGIPMVLYFFELDSLPDIFVSASFHAIQQKGLWVDQSIKNR